ncbi:MerR family transcriptional regulator [Vallitalea longa]|uniref:MerR family transcriptional regulator n=1 Tax=Vallitalea longa TaxID=2936439 RepID=A0A9W6DEV1_9FIRM|nr:MerR family transcriptional regulator [Vallitalea longa]GKX29910.1 MerR family transcriptional regulator [Vallitalea longa]
MNRRISLSDMSRLLNISKYTLRYYDKVGLIKPNYDVNGYRYYTLDHYYNLVTIKLLRQMDVPIKDIKKSLVDDNMEDFIDLLSNSKKHIDAEIERMIRVSDLIDNKLNVAKYEKSLENKWRVKKLMERKFVYFSNGRDELNTILELGNSEVLLESNLMVKYCIDDLEKVQDQSTDFYIEYDGKMEYSAKDVFIIPEGNYVLYYYKGNEQNIYNELIKILDGIRDRGFIIQTGIYEILRPSHFINSSNKAFFTEFNIPVKINP